MRETSSKSLRPVLPRWLQVAFFLTILGFLLAALVSGWDQVVTFDWRLNLPALAGAMLLLVIYMLLHGMLWTWMVRRLSLALPYGMGVRIYLSSQLAKYIPGGIWSFASVGLSGAQLGLPGTLLLLIYLVSTLLVLGVSALFAVPTLLVLFAAAPGVNVLVGVVLLAGVLLLPPSLRWLIRAVVRWRKLDAGIAAERLTGYRVMLRLLLVFAAIHLLAFGAFFLYFTSLVDVTLDQGIYAAMAWSGSWFTGLVILIVPSGMGVREATLVLLLAPIVPAPVAIALAFGYRLFTTLLDLLVLAGLLAGIGLAALRSRMTAAETAV